MHCSFCGSCVDAWWCFRTLPRPLPAPSPSILVAGWQRLLYPRTAALAPSPPSLPPSLPASVLPYMQVLVQDLVLKFQKGGGAPIEGGSAPTAGGGDDGSRGASIAERVASLAKLGGSRSGLQLGRVAEREASSSLLGPADQRSAAVYGMS